MNKIHYFMIVILGSMLIGCAVDSEKNVTTTNNLSSSNTGSNQTVTIFSLGKAMDPQDRVNVINALTAIPVGKEAAWTSSSSGNSYVVRPLSEYKVDSKYCRKATLYVENTKQMAFANICRYADGKWHLQH